MVVYLTEFDVLTTKFDLAVLSAAVNSISIGIRHYNVFRVVYAFTEHRGVRSRHLLNLFRLTRVSMSESNTPDERLSFDNGGCRTSSRRGRRHGCWRGGNRWHQSSNSLAPDSRLSIQLTIVT